MSDPAVELAIIMLLQQRGPMTVREIWNNFSEGMYLENLPWVAMEALYTNGVVTSDLTHADGLYFVHDWSQMIRLTDEWK